MLILPGNPEFDLTLATPPPDWKIKAYQSGESIAFAMDYNTNLFRPVTPNELQEYIEGGEYDEVYQDNCDGDYDDDY